MEEAPIAIMDMFVKKGLQLINVNPKQGGGQGATPFKPNGTPDEIGHLVNYEETTKD